MEDMMQLLHCFAKLDFRCSRVISRSTALFWLDHIIALQKQQAILSAKLGTANVRNHGWLIGDSNGGIRNPGKCKDDAFLQMAGMLVAMNFNATSQKKVC
ncbi:hypothetical protein BBBOND_0109060 [Babesia bigemina]|uniref:Uncharacterized protein n=1 Tax=Babesia bigemina TaxID=5866 RepID=A0A061D1U0_BABBI|nr:hypothetical protein BBBOND_0109060 [Babesia bigemina]CDR94608.1 hypothetical protein BBBOND_0109060 [Babesia bigemina]|eukprot:XP_012766794.1 hypothetical protein BBBOND_0109060 [Babesia bigemina]